MPVDPQQRIADQALRCRLVWRSLNAEQRAALVGCLQRSTDTWDQLWWAALTQASLLKTWLEGDAPPSALLDQDLGAPSPRQMFASNPFYRITPWLNLAR